MRNARIAGLQRGIYAAINGSLPDAGWHIQKSKEIVGSEWGSLSCVSVDVEIDNIEEHHIQQALDRVEYYDSRPLVYSAYWFWSQYLSHVTSFARYPLWNAYYDDHPDIDFAKLPYGGWDISMVVGEQYTNTTPYMGMQVDFNFFYDNFWKGEEPYMPTVIDSLHVAWNTIDEAQALIDELKQYDAAKVKKIQALLEKSQFEGLKKIKDNIGIL